jgi:hypothetical protein
VTLQVDQVCRLTPRQGDGTDDDDAVDDDHDKDDEEYDEFSLVARSAGGTMGTLWPCRSTRSAAHTHTHILVRFRHPVSVTVTQRVGPHHRCSHDHHAHQRDPSSS